MRLIYSAIFYLLTPWLLLHLVWRGFKNRAYWYRWPERFGISNKPVDTHVDIWLHVVSVGETQAAAPLVNKLLEHNSALKLLITTTTPTGSDRVKKLFSDRVLHVYSPYDLPVCVAKFLNTYQPEKALFMETELWPNMYHQCHQNNIPVMVLNARLSERSAAGYRRIASLTKQMLLNITCLAAQSKSDAARFISLGLTENKISITGSVKFDIDLPASIYEQGAVLRRCWGTHRSVLIAASTHDVEDSMIINAFENILKVQSDTLLVIVPRHPERFEPVTDFARSKGFIVTRRTDMINNCSDIQVFVGNSMGELPVYYAASDVAFVGGSLVDVGGHNMLEPAALGLPVLTGPYLFNFAEISEILFENQAAIKVSDVEDFTLKATALLTDANKRRLMGDNGKQVISDNRGALERVFNLISEL